MIEIVAAIAIQSALQQDAPALIRQSTDKLINSYGDMAEALGQCSHVYPAATAHPYVRQARGDVADLGVDFISVEADRVESVLFAREAARPADRSLTVAACAERIEDDAKMVSTHVQGLRQLLSIIERDAASPR